MLTQDLNIPFRFVKFGKESIGIKLGMDFGDVHLVDQVFVKGEFVDFCTANYKNISVCRLDRIFQSVYHFASRRLVGFATGHNNVLPLWKWSKFFRNGFVILTTHYY